MFYHEGFWSVKSGDAIPQNWSPIDFVHFYLHNRLLICYYPDRGVRKNLRGIIIVRYK